MSKIQLEGALRYVVSSRVFWLLVVVAVVVGATNYGIRYFKATCENSFYDWTKPPRICRLGCADDEVWSRQAKMCVMSCPAAGCL